MGLLHAFIVSLLFLSVVAEEGPCRSWYRSCKLRDLRRQWMCTTVEEYITYLAKGCSDETDPPPIPPPHPGQCAVVNDRCEFTTSAPKCEFRQFQLSMCQSRCMEVNNATPSNSAECVKYSRYPPPNHLCVPMNGKCQEYNPCYLWGGQGFDPFYCGTFDDYYGYRFGYLPEPPSPAAFPPGECILQNKSCSWSDCKGHLDFCRTFWMCGTAYDAKVYYAGPPPPCPAPPPNYTPPPPPGECQFSLTKRECGYEKVVGGDTRVPVEKGMSTEAGLKQSDIHHK